MHMDRLADVSSRDDGPMNLRWLTTDPVRQSLILDAAGKCRRKITIVMGYAGNPEWSTIPDINIVQPRRSSFATTIKPLSPFRCRTHKCGGKLPRNQFRRWRLGSPPSRDLYQFKGYGE